PPARRRRRGRRRAGRGRHLLVHAASRRPQLARGFRVPAMAALLRDDARLHDLDAESLEQLVLICLQGLANLAQSDGQKARAARLLDAAALLRDGQQSSGPDEVTVRAWDVSPPYTA